MRSRADAMPGTAHCVAPLSAERGMQDRTLCTYPIRILPCVKSSALAGILTPCLGPGASGLPLDGATDRWRLDRVGVATVEHRTLCTYPIRILPCVKSSALAGILT